MRHKYKRKIKDVNVKKSQSERESAKEKKCETEYENRCGKESHEREYEIRI